jgi:cyclopropane-fatty-acyl-phospholipid synthase
MVYSCAYFKNERDTLKQAQIQKINLCCQKLQLQPNERLLDIGCGWGSLLITAAKDFGIQGVGITLSKEQLEHGRQQIDKEGLQDRVHPEYLDYRDLPRMNQTFDKIVSVGMFEHVGKANMDHFLENTRKVLRPDGLFLLHTIGKTVEEPTDSWFKKYIFPGCHIPDLSSILKNSTSQGLSFIDCENIHLFQLLFSAGVRNDLPLTREWMFKAHSG